MAFVASLPTTSPVCGHLQHRPRCSHPVLPSLSSSFRGLSLAQRQPAARQQRACTQTFARQAGGSSEGRGDDRRGGGNKEPDDGFEERVVQVRRVTKVVKGGKQLSFRAVVVVGDGKGTVGVGCASAKEIAQAVQRAVLVAKRESVSFPLNKAYSLPHRIDGYWGAAKVMLRPAADGAGVIAGGAVRVVLELAGVRNCFGKQLGSANPLNNARATIEGLNALRTFKQVSQERGISVQELMGLGAEPQTSPSPTITAAAGAL